jgi:galactokinase/CTP:molybdopterin cytidylyltransferase MocA
VDRILQASEYRAERLTVDSEELLAVLRQAGHLLDWEGESIVPEGPQESLIDYLAANHASASPMTLALLYAFRRLYGAGAARIHNQVMRYARAVERFTGHYGAGPIVLARSPARINILGEHVDYVKYLPTEVLPFASREHDMLMIFRPTARPVVRARSTLEAAEPTEFALTECPAHNPAAPSLDEEWLAYLHKVGTPRRHWINYVKASVHYCALKYGGVRAGWDFLIDSTIPAAGGASSSSAVVVLSGAAARIANHIRFDPETLAEDSAKAEWYIGTRGGKMDHCTMCLASRQSAVHLNFTPFRASLVPLHRFRYRWVAFYSHPADKSGDVMLKFNERSAVSRLLIPALLDDMLSRDADLKARWQRVYKTLAEDTENITAAHEAREILAQLPESVTLTAMRRDYPAVYAELERGYPRLAQLMGSQPIPVRARALHHVGEVIRVRDAVAILKDIFSSRMPEEPEKTEPGLRAVGDLVNATHESMRDLYGLTTPDIDELVDVITSHPHVYGARLMGGGFGGNILALMSREHVPEVVDRVQERYYAPRGRNGLAEGSVTVSTPGEGFGCISLGEVLRQAVIHSSAIWWKWDRYNPIVEKSIDALLGREAGEFRPARPIQPVIVAGGRGKLRLGPGYRSPSALNVLNGRTSIEHVADAISAMPFPTLPPIVIVSPAIPKKMLDAMKLPPKTRFVVQPDPLGTGHAVMCALSELKRADADVLVVWGSQPLITPATLARSILVHQALGSVAMLFPTAVTRTPYAPIQRDLHGYVVASLETAREGAATKRLGETNVGAFVLGADTLRETLPRLHDTLWDAAARRYGTKSGELGFPNAMARALVSAGRAVIALPIAAEEEGYGLRDRAGYTLVKRILAARADDERAD